MTTLAPRRVVAGASAASWTTILTKLGPVIGLALVVALFSILRYDTFFTVGNFELILRLTAVVGIASLGMTLIIISGGIDLSVGSAVALVTVTIALLMPHQIGMDSATGRTLYSRGLPPWAAALVGIAAGTLIGVVNGTLVTRLKLVPFIITLGMMSILRGSAQGLADNTMVYTRDNGVLDDLLKPLSNDQLWLLTPGVWLMLGLALLVGAMLRYTRFGRYVFAIGSSEPTARLCGVPVERTKLLIYTLGAAL